VILCGLPTVQQAAIGDCLSFDPFPFDQNGLAPPEVDVGGRQVADALVISQVIVVGDEGGDLGFEIARQVIVFEQDAALERLMPAPQLSLGHRMIRWMLLRTSPIRRLSDSIVTDGSEMIRCEGRGDFSMSMIDSPHASCPYSGAERRE